MIQWHFLHFDALTTRQLFDLMKLRVDVFVVEQCCAYAELDEHDIADNTIHLLGFDDRTLAAYARAMPDSDRNPGDPSSRRVRIGRVVVAEHHRRHGLGRELMQVLLARLEQTCTGYRQELAAQLTAQAFYESLGFCTQSAPYSEDGILHVDMSRHPAPLQSTAPA